MGELTITTFLSLDGVMQASGGPGEDESGNFTYGGWTFPLFNDALAQTREVERNGRRRHFQRVQARGRTQDRLVRA